MHDECRATLRVMAPSENHDRPNILEARGEHDHEANHGKFTARFIINQ